MFSIIPDGATYREFVLLKDGQGILLRVAVPDDVERVAAFIRSLSAESMAMRFMGGVAGVSRKFVEELCDPNLRLRACLLAVEGEGEEQKILGLGNYVGGGGAVAEVAFMIGDAHQGRGIGTLVLERLAGMAAGAGYLGFEAELLTRNEKMANVFRDTGFETRRAMEGGIIHVQFPLSAPEALRERTDLRERVATANSLVPLLRPRVVAVAGASRDPGSVGNIIFRHILENHFQGSVYPINPKADTIEGVQAYASLAALPETPDLVILAVPATKASALAKRALERGARGLLALAAGFAETGPEGARRQARLLRLARSHGARLVGPNCLGLINTHAAVQLNASLAATMPPRGRVGFFSHSAALGVVILQYAAERGLGFSTFVSAGNRADVSGNDLLQYWDEDPDTDLALLYLETFGNPRRFARLARRISHRKPILCVKSARSHAGRRVALAHIAASPRDDAEVEALFHQAGVIRADTLEDLFDIALLLSHQPLPRGNRVAIVSNSGGVATICADACETHGMEIAGPGVVDLHAMAMPEHYERACQEALEHPQVDALIASFACLGTCDPTVVARAIRRAAVRAEQTTGIAKPTLLSLMGMSGAVPVGSTALGESGGRYRTFPSYRFPESAALALSKVVEYARFRMQPAGRISGYADLSAGEARRRVEQFVEGLTGSAPAALPEPELRELMAFFGVPIAEAAAPAKSKAPQVSLNLSADPDFGPIWRFHRQGAGSILRITPLTDLDIADVLERLRLRPTSGLGETLGRLTQLVEELPWLCALEAQVLIQGEAAATGPLPLQPSLRLTFCQARSVSK
ncbi:GNAT family N-acetyltransferase [Geothrix limicola]|uniref:GNAT family N-acetyltransferase n=1 Tax=Geothrix limicola TaxID=2927978 RepID=UPI00255740F9|nr:GNAT family N-acetyltransferase [Geothrix limicola]